MGFWEMFYKNKLALTGCAIVVLLFVVSLLAPGFRPAIRGRSICRMFWRLRRASTGSARTNWAAMFFPG